MTAHRHAPHPSVPSEHLSSAEHWEQRYAEADAMWSGKVNATLAAVLADLAPGDAIDLGCGEGGDVLWLAEQGWRAHGLDISATAVGRAREEASARGLDGACFEAADLEVWQPVPDSADLVTASFFQSDVALERTDILRRAAAALRPGGHLVSVSHAAPPSWADHHRADMLGAREEVQQLALPGDAWEVLIAEDRPRTALGPDGTPGEHLDAVVVVRRR
ncbi:class I SAM-dependent methyltransferase [Brachybacterium sp. AOP43-C2-M15]|uniref:class I SAM-dependent methyltransferase n=1 Tax=Brachybacterium sp. AOP43-C2-M15 TaxID=3457661 RepID=UPI004033409C